MSRSQRYRMPISSLVLICTLLLSPAFIPVAEAGGLLSSRVFARQVIDENGIPLRESEITLRLPGSGFQVVNENGFSVQALIASPLDGSKNLIPLNVLGAEVENGQTLKLHVDGPVSKGSVIAFGSGALTRYGQPYQLGDITLNDARRFLSPQQAALWGKAYEPTDVDLFPIQTYPGSTPAVGIPQPTDEFTVRANLEEHFQRFVDAGKLKPREMRRLLEHFDEPEQQALFVDPVTGQFEPHLMAMVLTTAGTPSEGAIKVILNGENPTGKAALVQYSEDLPINRIAESTFVTDTNGQVQWVILVNPLMKEEPFQAGSASVAHEGMHQDTLQGQNEEIAAKSVEINTWKQHLLMNSELASLGTRTTKGLSLQVLWELNSGKTGFPNPGIIQAPLLQDPPTVTPGSNFMDPSMDVILRNVVYSAVPNVDTPGNSFLDRYLNTVTRGIDFQKFGNNFDLDSVNRLDNINRFYTSADNFRLLQILKLQPVFGPTAAALGAAMQPLSPAETTQPPLQERY